jgi:pyrimidine-nucleoside phosphorylase
VTATDPRVTVAAKRDGRTLSPGEVRGLVEGFVRREVADPLAAAFLMACCIRGLDDAETLELARAMVDSGSTLDLSGLPAPTVDKHSTGGVADGVTLVFAPLGAALGLAVAKLSGRGLGHTGGTLDKLEAIPGLRTDLGPEHLRAQVERIGCGVAAQSADLVPADKRLYALRDATATVESVPLIAASVMSKKLAVRTDLIELDVKAGSGAFMKTAESATELAAACLRLARGWERACIAHVTDMSQPLGNAIGNALDVAEAVRLLRGEETGRLRDLTVRLAADAISRLLGLGPDDAVARAEHALADGSALERFRSMVEAQGGDARVVDDPESILPRAPVIVPIEAEADGVLEATDAEAIGRAAASLGAGRMRADDRIDPAVGIVCTPKIGDRIERGSSVGAVHARTSEAAREAAAAVLAAFTVTEGPVSPPPLVIADLG